MKKSFLFILALAMVSIGVTYAADCDVAAPSCAPAPTCGCAKCGNVFSGLFDCNNHCAQQPACSNCGSPANACCCNKIGCKPCIKPCFAPLLQPRCTYEKPACKSDWYPGKNLGILSCLLASPCCDPCAPKCGCGAPTCNSCNPCAPKCGPICNPCAPKCAPAAPACGCGAPSCNSCNPCGPCTVGNRCGQLSCGFCGAKAACAPAAPLPADPNAAPMAPAPSAACAPATCSPCAAPATCAPATCAPATCAPATCAPSCNPCTPIVRCEVDCGIIENWYPGKGIVNFFRVLTAVSCMNNSCCCGAPTCNACNPCAPKCAPQCAPQCAPKCAPQCAPQCAPVAGCQAPQTRCEFRPFGGLFADLFACNCFDCNPCAPKCAPACKPCAPKCAPKCAPVCNPCVQKCAPASPCAAVMPAATAACQPAAAAEPIGSSVEEPTPASVNEPTPASVNEPNPASVNEPNPASIDEPVPAQKPILPDPIDTVNSKSILSPSEMATASLGSITE